MSDKKDDLKDLKAMGALLNPPPLVQKVPNVNTRPHWMSFSVSGEAGQLRQVNRQSNVLFRIDRLVATDSSQRAGYGTEFNAICGNRFVVGDANEYVSTAAFPEIPPLEVVKAILLAKENNLHELALNIQGAYIAGKDPGTYICEVDHAVNVKRESWPTCQPAMLIAFYVKFSKTCTWYATAYGRMLP